MSRPNTLIVKVGGGARINLAGVADDLAASSDPVVVVHGANAARDELAAKLGHVTRVLTSVSGYQSVYSDDAAIDLLLMTYAGLVNKRLVELLQRRGRNAIGLTGLDGRLVVGHRNAGIRVREQGKTLLIRDRSGKPVSVNQSLLEMLLDAGYLPVVTVPLVDEEGVAINAENDDVVAAIQRALGAERVIQLIEAPGLLANPADSSSVRSRVTGVELAALEEAATGRFKRKMRALRLMLDGGGGTLTVTMADGRGPHPVADALAGRGTVFA
jgi:acetylglutamate/LysW-gamma-L-alpha-aminoadipate kinase